MPYSTVLFDLDGTLTDPTVGITNSLAYALDSVGRPPPGPERLREFVGPPLQDALATLGLDAANLETAVAQYRDYFGATGMYENEPYPGIEKVLGGLRDRGVRLAVATSKSAVFAGPILEHFGLAPYFECVVGAELDGSLRHKDQIIARTLQMLGIPPSGEVIMVGDREHDVVGARRCGLDCIGVLWGFGTAEELTAAGAVALVADRAELGRTLD
ncbi:MAG TPA: HAD family hydrolase [Mycobacteriales bacterium]|nr:HAD family hydrolase [Mycobacteriales bacterium]